MFKRFSYFFAHLLLVLMPLQGVAAANMSICNSMMQSNVEQTLQHAQAMQNMPCHEDMTSEASKQAPEKQQSPCKAICATLCFGLSAMTTLTSKPTPASFLVSAQLVNFPQQAYASITQPNFQRPPILLA